jgi:glycosyltransferase involved in cell wall biosynthesis
MSSPYVSVIIPVYNDSKRLQVCLNALENQTYPIDKYEVIVVDNGSETEVSPLVSSYRQAKATHESKPGSYAARNKGLSMAKGEIVAFTDSDCIPATDWIEKGVDNLLRIPNCGLVAGEIEIFFKDRLHPTAVELYDKIRGFEQRDFLENKHYGATANIFTFMEVVHNVGSFNENLKSGGDKEWGQRVYIAGYPQVFAKDALVRHPARYTYGELFQKISRIHLDIRHQGMKKILARLYRTLHPPNSEIRSGWKDPRLVGIKQKLKYTLMIFYVRGVRIIEQVRQLLGGEQQRS